MADDNKKRIQEENEIHKQRMRNLDAYYQELANEDKILKKKFNLIKEINELEEQRLKAIEEGNDKAEKQLNEQLKQKQKSLNYNKEINKESREYNTLLSDSIKKWAVISKDYLLSADESVRDIQRNLGLSNAYSETVRDNFSDSVYAVAELGSTMRDVVEAQKTYTDLTGKSLMLAVQQQRAIQEIAQGTGLGAQMAGEIVANFEELGMSAEATASYVTDIMNSSEEMGINGVKAVETISKNFRIANTFNFQRGKQAFGEMVQYAQKMRVNVEQMFQTMEKFNTLEGALEASANLQVLGGQFAKLSDPIQLGFLARNNPEEFIKKINEMTAGLAVFNKETGQMQISAHNMDRLRQMAEITGQDVSSLVEQANRMSKVQLIGSKMFGFSQKEQELVSNLARFNEGSKSWVVDINGETIDVQSLESSQIKQLQNINTSLEDRAIAAQSFNTAFSTFQEEMKATLLPLLNIMNTSLGYIRSIYDSTIKPALDGFKDVNESFGGIVGGLSILLGMGVVGSLAKGLVSLGGKGVSSVLSIFGKGGGGGFNPTSIAKTGKALTSFGVAVAGIGAGIYMASTGMANLNESLKGLSDEQLNASLKSMGLVLGTMAVGMVALAVAGGASAGPLLAFGGAVAMIGGGVYLASTGMAELVSSFEKLDGVNLDGISKGMLSMAGASLIIGNPMSLAGLYSMSKLTDSLSNTDFTNLNNAFYNINDFLKSDMGNLQILRDTLKELNESDNSFLKDLKELKNLFNKPLKVEFANKDVTIKNDITLKLDKDVLIKHLDIGKRSIVENMQLSKGRFFRGSV